jgi:hypothetical protein
MTPTEYAFPLPLTAYPPAGDSLLSTLVTRVEIEPFNLVATAIFALAITHTFLTAQFMRLAHAAQRRHDRLAAARGEAARPSVLAEVLHLLGEVEVVFGVWAVVLMAVMSAAKGWGTGAHYLNDVVNYTEPLFVVVVMALAATRPIVVLAESVLRRFVTLGGGSPAAWWVVILTIGPLFGSLITEPAAMTICALLLARQFFDLSPSTRLKYATLGLLFVNVSIGGTLTAYAAPPVLMVARPWRWDTYYMDTHIGWRAVLAIVVATAVYFVAFRREFATLARRPAVPDVDRQDLELSTSVPGEAPMALPVPPWVTMVHLAFLAWAVLTSHYPVLCVGGFLFFLGFARATAPYQGPLDLRAPLLVGFFLGGLVIHGTLQAWWIAPILGSLSADSLFAGGVVLTAFNDNALVTYLATLVPDLSEASKLAIVEGAVAGGGLTVIANAPNPAGQALLGRFFGGAIHPFLLFAGALGPTLVTIAAFRAF